MPITYEVTHTEYRKIAGYKVPVQVSDGTFTTADAATAHADRERNKNRRPYFVEAKRSREEKV